jgi:ribosomal protein S18 acetylase RimI-like enzyme
VPNAGLPFTELQGLAEARSVAVIAQVRSHVLPRLLVVAEDRGWWDPLAAVPAPGRRPSGVAEAAPTIIPELDAGLVDRLVLAPRTLPPADPEAARGLLLAALRDGARASGAVAGDQLVGAALILPAGDQPDELLALGVAPGYRRQGIATALLAALTGSGRPVEAHFGVAERDVVEPLSLADRVAIGQRLLNPFQVPRAR